MATAEDIKLLQQKVAILHTTTTSIRSELSKVIIGQPGMIDGLLCGLLCNGHVLLEGVPGLAKTLTIKSLAQALNLSFSRIQFTPDLLPGDVIGTLIYNQQRGEFMVRKGPVFANFVLADEINRAPAKVQSALLEAMQEKQITLGDTTYKLQEPFLVLATQNPLEQEGTYPLPEAQQDRFLLKIKVDYPTRSEELEVMRGSSNNNNAIRAVAGAAEIVQARQLCAQLYMDEKIEHYILDIVQATRKGNNGNSEWNNLISYGASPRASISMAMASRAMAMLQQRAYVVPDDVKQIAPAVLRHRIGLTYEAEADSITTDDIISKILNKVKSP